MNKIKYCGCGGLIRWMLAEDLPGLHVYVEVCVSCRREGEELVVLHKTFRQLMGGDIDEIEARINDR